MMRGSFAAEILKQRKRATTWVLLATAATLGLVFAYVLPYAGYLTSADQASPPALEALASVQPAQLVSNTIGGFAVFTGGIALIFGALAMGGEYGWGTLKTILTQRPARLSVYAGKLLALAALVLGGVLVLFAVGAVTSAGIAAAEGQPLDFPAAVELVQGVLAGWLVLGMWCLVGVVAALTFRSVALPVGLGVVWILGIENLISAAAETLLTSLQPFRDVLPATNAGSLIGALTTTVGDATPGVTDAVSGTRALVTLGVYVTVLTVAGAMMLRRRDVA